MKTVLALSIVFARLAFAEPVGFYTDGSLENAGCLPGEGEGYMQLYRDVGHIWAADPLLGMIAETGRELGARYPHPPFDRLQVEEMSAQHGGEVDGHNSHENGLDVDLQYYKRDRVEHVPTAGQYYAPEMVRDGVASENFDVARNWELMKALHRHGDVQRIFVDRALKAALCRHARASGEFSQNVAVLRSLQHQPNHADHMHVRLRCPPRARRCRPQADPPPGAGCP